ncbi:MAG: LacI family DNA-binding transcriptional regulator [Chloroflexota bacterium]
MATVKEVAELADVSPSTVSAVFGGRVPVREKTRQRVLAAAKQLDYRPNGAAQTLRTGQSRLLGVCASFVKNPTVAAIVHGASIQAQTAGYALTMSPIGTDPSLEKTHLDLLARQRVAAIITYATTDDPYPYEQLQKEGIPVVFIGSRPAGLVADRIMSDVSSGTALAVRHLLGLGRRRVGFLMGPPHRDISVDRLAAYRAVHREMGLAVDEDLICTGLRGSDEAYAATRLLLERKPDALLAGIAGGTLGAISCLLDLHVSMPDEVAFVGTGDVEWARLLRPSLSMIEISGELIGRRSVELAMERLNPQLDIPPHREVYVPVNFVVRASSAGQEHGESTKEPLPGRPQ